MPSLDGYSLNEEIKKVKAELKAELLELRNEFTDLYQWMKKADEVKKGTKKSVKKKATKVLETTESAK